MSLVQIGMITLDNASNNNTMMEEMASELGKLDIPFNVDGNRIRCVHQLTNLSVLISI